MVLLQVVGVLLVGGLGEEGLLPQVGGQVGVGLRDGGVGSLGCKQKEMYKNLFTLKQFQN